MRFFVPLALLATSVMAADKTAQDQLNDTVPECVRSCYSDAITSATGCDSLTDTDCLCDSIDKVDSDNEDISNSMASCIKKNISKCSADDAKKATDMNAIAKALSEFQSSCSDTGAAASVSPSNLLMGIGAGALMIVAAV